MCVFHVHLGCMWIQYLAVVKGNSFYWILADRDHPQVLILPWKLILVNRNLSPCGDHGRG